MPLHLKILSILAALTIFIGIVGWVITMNVDPIRSPYATAWQITWIANPIGLLLSIYLLSNKVKYSSLLVILNFIMIISFGPMWFIGDLFEILSK